MSSGIHPFDELDLSDVEQLIDELEGEDAALPEGDRGHDIFDYQPVSGATGEPGDEARLHTHPGRSTQQPAAGDQPGPSTQASKKAKLKEKNRQAQARYRQRKLVRCCAGQAGKLQRTPCPPSGQVCADTAPAQERAHDYHHDSKHLALPARSFQRCRHAHISASPAIATLSMLIVRSKQETNIRNVTVRSVRDHCRTADCEIFQRPLKRVYSADRSQPLS